MTLHFMAEAVLKQVSASPTGRPVREPLSYQEFLAWADEDTHAEWVDGRVQFMSPVSREHSLLAGFLSQLIRFFVESHQLGEVHSEPFQMKTGPDLPGRSPDLLFVAREHLPRLRENYLDGPADLVVEVISPESRGRDRGEKFYEYEAGGVGEYWLIDPLRRRAEFYELGPDRLYRLRELQADGRFESGVLPGFWLRVTWLWEQPHPILSHVLNEWGVV
jgi:Uma2 family endonuclease